MRLILYFFELLRKLSNFSVNRQQRFLLINLINFINHINLIFRGFCLNLRRNLINESMSDIKKTCLHDRHVAMGAMMSPFAGWDMPIQYSGITEEHNAVREAAGLFDVSHMGEFLVEGPDAVKFVDRVFTNEVAPMTPGQVAY